MATAVAPPHPALEDPVCFHVQYQLASRWIAWWPSFEPCCDEAEARRAFAAEMQRNPDGRFRLASMTSDGRTTVIAS